MTIMGYCLTMNPIIMYLDQEKAKYSKCNFLLHDIHVTNRIVNLNIAAALLHCNILKSAF